jgi:hypothetical protein
MIIARAARKYPVIFPLVKTPADAHLLDPRHSRTESV